MLGHRGLEQPLGAWRKGNMDSRIMIIAKMFSRQRTLLQIPMK